MLEDMVDATVLTQLVFRGGAGKSTATRELAVALGTIQKKKVLVIDLDDTFAVTLSVGIDPLTVSPSIYDVFSSNTPISTVIKHTRYGFDIVPGHRLVAAIEMALEEGDEAVLRNHLSGVLPDYDFVLIDPPPAKMLMITRLILTAADQVIIPLKCQRQGLNGVNETLNYIQTIVWRDFNRDLGIFGIFPTIYRRVGTHSSGIVQKARELWGDKVLPYIVPDTDLFPNADDEGMPALIWQPTHEALLPYIQLAELINQKLGKTTGETTDEVA